MNINITEPDINEFHTSDNYVTMGVLDINGIRVKLSEEDIMDLQSSINEFINKKRCYNCQYYMGNKYGINYSGSCSRMAKDHNKFPIKDVDVGYIFCVDHYDLCKYE